jgi:hypothetical protein
LLCIIDFLFLWLYIIFLTLVRRAAMSQRMTHASKTDESAIGKTRRHGYRHPQRGSMSYSAIPPYVRVATNAISLGSCSIGVRLRYRWACLGRFLIIDFDATSVCCPKCGCPCMKLSLSGTRPLYARSISTNRTFASGTFRTCPEGRLCWCGMARRLIKRIIGGGAVGNVASIPGTSISILMPRHFGTVSIRAFAAITSASGCCALF